MKIFDFDDVQLLPKRGLISSRSEASTKVKLGNHEFRIPVVPANMKTIIDEAIAIEFAQKGYFYVMHRFDIDTVAFVKKLKDMNLVTSISVGVKDEWYGTIEELAKLDLIPDFITIDIAHGHALSMKNMIEHIRKYMGKKTFIIAGNVATPTAVNDLERWGADATKVGVGPGKVCITRLKTGFGTAGWQLAAVKWCSKAATRPIIADGGIRHHGDIAKAMRFGAHIVMTGAILSGHKESPGKMIDRDGVLYKEYFGSASEFNKGIKKNIEGKKELVEVKGSLWDTLEYIEQDLQSAISYAGGKNLNALKHVDYILLKSTEGF